MASLTVHHLEQSRSQRVLWLLEELGLEYEIQRYPRVKGRAPKALRDIHPLGRSPVVTHGDKVLAESGAVVEYILDTFGEGRLRPAKDSSDFEQYRFFLHFAEGSMMAPLLLKLVSSKLREKVPLIGKRLANTMDAGYADPELRSQLSFVNDTLEGRDWIAGELSGADMLMSYPLQAAMSRSGVTEGVDNIRRYVQRIEARPAYVRATERGGESGFG